MIIDLFVFMLWFYFTGFAILGCFWVLLMMVELSVKVWEMMVHTHNSRGKY